MLAFMHLEVYRIPAARFLNEAVSLRIVQYKERGLSSNNWRRRAVLYLPKIRRGSRGKVKERRKETSNISGEKKALNA